MKYLNDMIINNYDIRIESLAVHWVGNKTNDDGTILSKSIIELTDDISSVLLKYFIPTFENEELYSFTHNSDVEMNEVYSYVTKIFEDPESLHEQSILLAKYLYELSEHPNIKVGEFYVVYFSNCEVGNNNIHIVGIFKSENKDTFLEVHSNNGAFQIDSEQGTNINKLDKGCLIYNIEKEAGYAVSVIDNTNKGHEAKYWIDNFLHVIPRKDEYYHTQNLMAICKNYVAKHLPNEFGVAKDEQVEFLNRSIQYFKENQKFNISTFTKEVISQPEIIESFKLFKKSYQENHEIEISDEFSISSSAVKKQTRNFKGVIKLDKNFHIYIHSNNQFIKRGYDEATGMYYYQLFFKEEL